MSNLVQFQNTNRVSPSESKQQTDLHLLFYEPSSRDLELRLQEVRMLHPTCTLAVHPLKAEDAVGQITEVLSRVPTGMVQSLFFISGNECTAEELESPCVKSGRADRRLAQWQTAFKDDAKCYLLGDDLAGLAAQLQELTELDVRRDFEAGLKDLQFDELIFVDHATVNFESLIQQILLVHDAEIVSLDPSRDGLGQIANALKGRQGVKAIHLVCPGNESSLILGQAVLNYKNLEHRYRDTLAQIGKALAQNAEIRIYNPTFNSENRGIATIRELSSSTGAFVVVAGTQAQQLTFDSDFVRRFQAPSFLPQETAEWSQRFQPLPTIDGDMVMETTWRHSPELDWNQTHTELVIRTRFDRAQALGWACIGFAAGCVCPLLAFALGFWGW